MTTPPSLSERIADGIVAVIRETGLAPGDALESSRDLARRFEVTVPTVREALRRLEGMDVVRFRHGSGIYVAEGLRRRLVVNPHAASSGLAPVLELVDARLMLEPPIAGAAARNRTDEQLAALEAAAGNSLVPQVGHERPARHFHTALAAASGNALVCEAIGALLDVRARDQIEIRRRYNDRERDHAEHLVILAAVRDRDEAAATALTRDHLQAIRDALRALAETPVPA